MNVFGFWRRSIFIRLVLTFLIIMVPLFGIGISMYNWGVTAIKREMLNTKASQMSYYLDKLEKEIQGLKLVQSDTLYNDDINMLANNVPFMDNYERGYYLNKLQQRLSAIKNGSNYIENVIAIIPSIGRTIPAEGSIEELQAGDLQRMAYFDGTTPAQLIYTHEQLLLNAYFPPNSSKQSPQPLYAVMIKLSLPRLKASLEQFNANENSGSFLLDARKQLLISGIPASATQERIRSLAGPVSGGKGSGSLRINGERFLYIYDTSPYLGLTLVNYVPESSLFAGLGKYKLLFWLLSIAVFLIIILFSLTILRFIRMPLYTLIRGFKRLENGDMDFAIGHRMQDEFGFLYDRFNSMVGRLRSLIDQNYKQTIMVQRAELKQLQAQINPHFLYNSFFILYTMTKRGEYEQLMKFQLQLGEYFQFVTRNASDEVTLEQEVGHARTYCDIQSRRFFNRIRVEFDELPPDYEGVIVPRLILQPIIENAFEHGLEHLEENGLLSVRFLPEPDGLRIEVANNGAPMPEELLCRLASDSEADGQAEATGLINIHRRIRLLLGTGSGLRIASGSSGVTVAIWLETPAETIESSKGDDDVYAVDRR
ncbi:two-component sensor histidine kinase [Paenibacillus lycopersici]|uniref:Two-component sensor histidine kinase n=1 Tax=Paenibacillus lycopersici TaxID=2704462 RepID=A0A6C0G481_9BACL|nr:histidine kinase [Paenibacillus lycopersici]QHT62254.1 two-component sensor histidine kinase [Paenibacillus lycopersici]